MQLWYIAHVRQDQSDAPLISFSVSEQSIPLFSSILLTENLLCVCVCAHMGSTACVRARTHTPVGSSTDDCFDVYFTAVAENRWLLGAAARCQSESKCNSVYRSVCGLMWACVCTAVTLRLHPHVFIDCVRELLSVYVNEVPFKHGRLSSNTFSSPTCSTWVELCAARTVHSQQGKTEVRWMSCWAAPFGQRGKHETHVWCLCLCHKYPNYGRPSNFHWKMFQIQWPQSLYRVFTTTTSPLVRSGPADVVPLELNVCYDTSKFIKHLKTSFLVLTALMSALSVTAQLIL